MLDLYIKSLKSNFREAARHIKGTTQSILLVLHSSILRRLFIGHRTEVCAYTTIYSLAPSHSLALRPPHQFVVINATLDPCSAVTASKQRTAQLSQQSLHYWALMFRT